MNRIRTTTAVAVLVAAAAIGGCRSAGPAAPDTRAGGQPTLGGNASPSAIGNPGVNGAGTGVNGGGTLPMNGMH